MRNKELNVTKFGIELPDLNLKITDLEVNVAVLNHFIAICIGDYVLYAIFKQNILSRGMSETLKTFARRRQVKIVDNKLYVPLPTSITNNIMDSILFQIINIKENDVDNLIDFSPKGQKIKATV